MLLDDLNKLYDFQESLALKDKLEKDLKTHSGRKELLHLRKKIEEMEEEYKTECERQKELKKELALTELKSKEIDTQIHELEERIYSGEIKTVRELSSLQSKQDNLKNILEKTDNNALELMLELDKLQKSLNLKKKMILSMKKEYNEKRLKIKQELDKINEEIIHLSTKAQELERQIPIDLMNKYRKIEKTKPLPVSKLVDGKCSGCRMDVSVMVAQEVSRHVRVIFCESCGRILF